MNEPDWTQIDVLRARLWAAAEVCREANDLAKHAYREAADAFEVHTEAERAYESALRDTFGGFVSDPKHVIEYSYLSDGA